MNVVPDIARSKGTVAVHDGHEEFFCSTRCRDKFVADPGAYLSTVRDDQAEKRGAGPEDEVGWSSYAPLAVVLGLILIASLSLGLRDARLGALSANNIVLYFMMGFFLVFAGFKLIDLNGFAEGYSTYDLLAQRWFGYGYVYPFIELGFGLAMLAGFANAPLLWAELVVMTFSGIGVAIKLARGERFQCACLGTFLKVPLTKVTLVEDFGMAAFALYLLLQ